MDSTYDGKSTRGSFQITMQNDHNYLQFAAKASNNGELLLNDTKIGYLDEWISLRFEIVNSSTIQVCAKDSQGIYRQIAVWTDFHYIGNLTAFVNGFSMVSVYADLQTSINIDNIKVYE